jgi:hypothetical protein
MSEICQVYVPLPEGVEYRRTSAEKVLRRHLLLRGWKLWYTDYFMGRKHDQLFMQHTYRELCAFLEQWKQGCVSYLEHLARVYHAMPAFFCYRDGVSKFVACSFEQEPLGRAQREVVLKLLEAGFLVEVYTIVDRYSKAVQGIFDVQTGQHRVTEAQLTISAAKRRAEKEKEETLLAPYRLVRQ